MGREVKNRLEIFFKNKFFGWDREVGMHEGKRIINLKFLIFFFEWEGAIRSLDKNKKKLKDQVWF